MPIQVVAAEDSLLVREGLRTLLGLDARLELVSAHATADAALDAVAAERPDVVLTDIRMPPSHTDEGIRLAQALRDRHPEIGVVVLSQHLTPEYAIALLDAGSARRGYLLKDRLHDLDTLGAAIATVAAGGCHIDPLVVEALLAGRAPAPGSPLDALTPRELEILGDIAGGLSNQGIADRRVLTRRAVEKHATAIFSKLGLADAQDTSRRVRATLVYLAETGR